MVSKGFWKLTDSDVNMMTMMKSVCEDEEKRDRVMASTWINDDGSDQNGRWALRERGQIVLSPVFEPFPLVAAEAFVASRPFVVWLQLAPDTWLFVRPMQPLLATASVLLCRRSPDVVRQL